MERLQYVIWRENKHFVAQCLNVDVSSFGSSKKEALKNIKEAIELYFEGEPKDESIRSIENPEVVSGAFSYA